MTPVLGKKGGGVYLSATQLKGVLAWITDMLCQNESYHNREASFSVC